ncbi:MAG: chorismate mutase [Polaribacter sp.]|jgi:chorismate mutase
MTINQLDRKYPNKPFLIAGPCSAETEEQVMETARQLAGQEIELFRAGIWKPRTRPNSFEGVGTPGLKWLKRVKEETGMKVTTEVANTQHVFLALKHNIDVLWLGARTTVNPFSVQEIADAVEGVDIPILIKNPINPDLKLWMGAIERIYKAGITKIGLIHRGFSVYGKSPFRNIPRWQIPIELKKEFPDLMLLCDNSHICGRRDTLQAVAQKALDLNYDGLMTETHIDPDNAWSDAAQQITPAQYQQLFSELVLRKEGNGQVQNDLVDLRSQIDVLDDEILNLLGRRMQVADAIGRYKKENGISILQAKRWAELLEAAKEKAKDHGLGGNFIEAFLKAIHEESIDHQNQVMNEGE